MTIRITVPDFKTRFEIQVEVGKILASQEKQFFSVLFESPLIEIHGLDLSTNFTNPIKTVYCLLLVSCSPKKDKDEFGRVKFQDVFDNPAALDFNFDDSPVFVSAFVIKFTSGNFSLFVNN